MDALIAAAASCDITGLRQNICAGINNVTSNNWSPLLLCVEKRGLDCITFLLENGADPNQRGGQSRRTALLISSFRGYPDVTAILVKYGADVNAADDRHETPLHIVAKAGDIESAKILLTAHPNLLLTNDEDKTAEEIAIANGHHELAKLLHATDSAEADLLPIVGSPTVTVPPVVTLPITPITFSPSKINIFQAAQQNHVEIVQEYCQSGKDVNVTTGRGWTPLLLAVESKSADIVKLLLSNGANVNGMCGSAVQKGALHISAFNGDATMTELLLQHGADVNMLASNGCTPLHSAAASQQKNIQVALLLLKHGCCIYARNDKQQTAEDIACGTPFGDFLAPRLPPIQSPPDGIKPYVCPSYPSPSLPPCSAGAFCKDQSQAHMDAYSHRYH